MRTIYAHNIVEKSVSLTLVSETSTISKAIESKAMTLTFRRGLYSFIWWQGSRRPQKQVTEFVRALFLCVFHISCIARTNSIRLYGTNQKHELKMKKSLILLGVIGLMAIPASATQTLDGPHDREGEACHVRVNGWNENGRLQHFENRNSNTGSVNGNGNVSGTASSNMGVANLSVNAGGSIGASSSNTSQESYSGY